VEKDDTETLQFRGWRRNRAAQQRRNQRRKRQRNEDCDKPAPIHAAVLGVKRIMTAIAPPAALSVNERRATIRTLRPRVQL
jgi:hypothetical protein